MTIEREWQDIDSDRITVWLRETYDPDVATHPVGIQIGGHDQDESACADRCVCHAVYLTTEQAVQMCGHLMRCVAEAEMERKRREGEQ